MVLDVRQWLTDELVALELAVWARVLPIIRLAQHGCDALEPIMGWWWMPISGLAVGVTAALVSRLVE
jgi:hypothetical protein